MSAICYHNILKPRNLFISSSFRSPAEKEKWVNAITGAVDAYYSRKTSFQKLGSGRRKKSSQETPDSPSTISSPNDAVSQIQ